MPSDDKKEDQQSSLDLTNPEIVQSDNSLPPLVPPQTTTPAQINQVNINQIPPKAWDRLSPEQIVALTSKILDQADRKDQRHFEIAKQQAGETAKNNRVSVWLEA